MTGREEFSVYVFDCDDGYEEMLRFVDAETAVEEAHRISKSVGAQFGLFRRIIITDGGDHTTFEWKHGEGVTFPTAEMRAKARQQT